MKQSAYQSAGVDIEAGAELVERIKPFVKKTARSGVASGIGGFGAFFDIKATGYKDPLLVSGTDGVGTKLRIAIEANCHDTIGIDLVAMCVNDIVVGGAEPLFFLDYFATGHLDTDSATAVISGIAAGCELAGCALVGGETAEMPGMYSEGDYDLAGFTVGAVERDQVISGDSIAEGHVVIGLPSSGPHSNGYSLIRKIVQDSGANYADPAPFADGKTLGEALLEPTRIYVKPVLEAIKKLSETGGSDSQKIRGMAHITGGGLTENLPRILPQGLGVKLDANSWALPAVFQWLGKTGAVSAFDMAQTFNCGIGLAIICHEGDVDAVSGALTDQGEAPVVIGRVCAYDGEGQAVQIDNLDEAWGL